jgi:hypothetical protein
MSLESLLAFLDPPTSPWEVPTKADWRAAEGDLGRLPRDYKAFLDLFGTGAIDNFLWVLNPASRNPYLNLNAEMRRMLGALSELRSSGEPCPYPLHPEPNGLMAFAKTENGDGLYWLTVGAPECWPVIVNAARDPTYERFDCDMTGFLEDILARRIRCTVFPEAFPTEPPAFTVRASKK